MWRSLFYSVGIGLFALGLQSLVIDHVTVPKDTKFQKLIKKILSDDKPGAAGAQAFPQIAGNASNYGSPATQGNQPNWNRQPQQVQYPPTNPSYGVDTGSRFGPSRFSGPAYGTGYGGPRVTSAPPARQPNFAGQYQNGTDAQLAAYRAAAPARPAVKKQVSLQKISIREWMPWSLLASGAIIFLYTHTHHRRRNHE